MIFMNLILLSDVLCVTVLQIKAQWRVTYISTEICALKGSTVDINCIYRYPHTENDRVTRVVRTLWFTNKDDEPTDLRLDSDYAGRVEYHSWIDGYRTHCRLRINDLRESDSAVYKFRFITNQPGGRYTGEPGVFLIVTDAPKVPSVSVSPSGEIVEGSSVTLTCSSDANPAANYTWYKKNGNPDQEAFRTGPQLDFVSIQSSDSGEFSCTAQNELGENTSDSTSTDVKYAPKVPSVSVSPSGEIVEGSSVNLTCSSDANPAATYTWYKKNGNPVQEPFRTGPQLDFVSIQSSDSGEFHCTAQNELGAKRSYCISIDDHSWTLFPSSPLTLERFTAQCRMSWERRHLTPPLLMSNVSEMDLVLDIMWEQIP
uniref:B-cell receptor CD22 n=1 Tax=Myripristis murdjan TaxID=586833 RepID=A0A668AGH9_9TELE